MSESLLAGLNPEQRAAVTLPHESALVLAGAGSGKTRVLTTRIAYLIQTHQASPHNILAVTFTNKAAKEMLTRLAAMLPINVSGMWIGTFHGLCNRLLRTHYRDASLPQLFQILDSQDQQAAIKRLMKSLNIDDEKYPPKTVQNFINSNKEAGHRAGDLSAHDPFTRRLIELFAAYDEQCQREGVVDFAELLLRSYELLSRNEALREHYRNRFTHILVDEFQDTNRLQYRWLHLLAGPQAAVFAVGDDDQSIYAFRGANVGNMREFERDFNARQIIRLEQNYRSHGHILNAANALIKQNSERLGKNLWTSEGEGEPIRVFEAASDNEEADFIVDEVKSLQREEGINLSDVALLYRSNAQSRVLEHKLFNAGIPYRVYGGLRFFERQEIKHALAYLRLIANQNDDGAFLRVVNFPPRGIGARTIENLQDAAQAAGVSLWQAAGGGAVGGRGGASLQVFVRLIAQAKEVTQGLPLAELVEHVLAVSTLIEHYEASKGEAERVENLNELVNAAAAFEQEVRQEEEIEGLAGFLSHASLEAGEHQAGSGQEALQLMTVHAAKGLEFYAVFVSGLEEGLFPHDQSFNDADGIQEERRLMYVAITRARRRLYLTHAQSRMLHGQVRYGLASRFLDELPANVLKAVGGRSRPTGSSWNGGWNEGWRTNSRSYDEPAQPAFRPKNDTPVSGGFHIGQSVSHAKFGTGVVIGSEGYGDDVRLQIKFAVGAKWLSLKYAKLEPA